MPSRRSLSASNKAAVILYWVEPTSKSAAANSCGIELDEILDLLADADDLHRQAELRLDREHDAALGGAVELGEHDAGHVDRVGELLGLHEPVLAGRRVDHEQHLLARALGAIDDAAQLLQLLHEVRLRVQAAGGVDEHEVGARLDAARHRVEHDRARDRRRPGRARARRRCARPTARADRRPRRGTCRPRRARPGGPRRTCCAASLPIVVVFPTPLTPTNIHTFGSPATPAQRAARARVEDRDHFVAHERDEPVGVDDVVGLGAGAHRVEDALRRRRARRRRGASPPRARPTSSSSILRPRRPVNTPENAARVRPSRSRSRGFSDDRLDQRAASSSSVVAIGVEVGDLELRRRLGFERGDRLGDRRRRSRSRPGGAAGSPGATARRRGPHGRANATSRRATADDDEHHDDATTMTTTITARAQASRASRIAPAELRPLRAGGRGCAG